jgi:hypothetical protein
MASVIEHTIDQTSGPLFKIISPDGLTTKNLSMDNIGRLAIENDILFTSASDFSSYVFYSDQLDTPNNANWKVNASPTTTTDPANAALVIRRFDDTAEQGVGFILRVPKNTVNVRLAFIGRAITAPATPKQVILKAYNRIIRDGFAVGAWSNGTELLPISIPTNVFFLYSSEIIPIATLGIVAARTIQFEITRNGASANDTLVGDFALLEVIVDFS